MADMAMPSMVLTIWLTSLTNAFSTGFISWREIDSSVISASLPHLTVLASAGVPVPIEVSGYSEPGCTDLGARSE
jgi:hypothetical protein